MRNATLACIVFSRLRAPVPLPKKSPPASKVQAFVFDIVLGRSRNSTTVWSSQQLSSTSIALLVLRTSKKDIAQDDGEGEIVYNRSAWLSHCKIGVLGAIRTFGVYSPTA